MDDQKRGDDAADHAPRPGKPADSPNREPQDAPNDDDRTDDGHAIKDDDLSSANDE